MSKSPNRLNHSYNDLNHSPSDYKPPSGRIERDQHIYAKNVASRLNITQASMIPIATGVKPISKEDGPKIPEEGE